MSKSIYSEKSSEKLLKTRKALVMIASMLAGAIASLFLLNLYNSKIGCRSIAVPLALSPIVMLNVVNIREISKEPKRRNVV